MLETPIAGSAPSADRAAWPAVYALAFGAFGVVAAELLPVSILTPVAVDSGASLGAVAQSVAMTAAVAAITGPLLVLGAGRVDRRPLIWMLMALLIVSSLVGAFAPDRAERAGALMAVALQVAIASGAVMGGVLIDNIGPTGVMAYAAVAVLGGALTILTFGRAEERRRVCDGCPA